MHASDADLALLFTDARTHNGWQDKPVEDELLYRIYDLMKWGPTTTNSCPLRVVFVKSEKAKEKLKPCLAAPNVEKTMTAPVTAIFAYDLRFFDKLPFLSPKNNAVTWYQGEGKERMIQETAFRSGTLQAAYFMLAARALGLDCAPMSGFNNAKVDEAFFKDSAWKSNFICALGHGDASKLYPRGERLPFGEACRIE